MGDYAQTEEAPRIEIGSQTTDDLKNACQKKGLRILHVDDDPCLLDVSEQILAMETNFEVDFATSVDEALKKMEKQTYDAVVSDYEMPSRNGLDFLKELRERQNDVPFILFTGKGREEVVVKALNLGADSYINKHGSPETVYCELADAINKTVERKKARELLVASESKYRTLVEKSLQGILVTLAAPLRLVFCNEAMEKFLGYSVKELLSLSPEGIMGLVHPEDRAVFFKRMENRFRGEPAESCLEFRAVRKDGSIIWLNAFANRVEYDGQPAVLGMFLDVDESKKAGEILRETEQRYRELANSLPDIVFETDINGQLVFVNERAAEISGYSHKELEKGLDVLQFLMPEDRERATKNIHRLLAGGRYVPAEYTFIRKDGKTFPALITAAPCISKGKVTGLRGLVLDITERKQAEEALRESEESLRSLIDSMDDLVFVLGFDGVFKNYHQPSHKKELYAAPEEFIGKHFRDVLPPQVAELCQAAMERIDDSGETQEFDYYMGMNGGKFWYNARLSPVKDQSGRKTSVTVVVRNITERKKAQEAVNASLKRYQSFIEVTGELGWTTNAAGEVFEDVPSFRNFTGQTYDEVKGWGWTKAVHPDDVEQATQAWQAAVAAKTKYEVEYRLRRRDGVYRNFMARGAPILNENGEIHEWVGTCIDITEHKKAEKALSGSEAKFRSIVENSSDQIFMLDRDLKFLHMNKVAANTFGLSPSEVVGKSISEVFPETLAALFAKNINKVIDAGKNVYFDEEIAAGDHESYQSTSLNPVRDDSGRVVAVTGIVRDITNRKRAEKLLQESEEKFRAIFEGANDGILAADAKTKRFLFANPRICEITGYSLEELLKLGVSDIHPKKDLPYVIEGFEKQLEGKLAVVKDIPVLRKDERVVYCDVSSRILRIGSVECLLGMFRDSTERRKAEEKLKETNLKVETVNEKLRVLGGLTRHDVRNKLGVISNSEYLLRKHMGDKPELVKYLDAIKTAIDNSNRLFEFSHMCENIGAEELAKLNVAECFNKAAGLLPRSGKIGISNECKGLEVAADSLLTQLFYNLVDNSIKHGEKVTQIRLHFSEDGNGVNLFYEDNGVGVSYINKPKLFEHGFTTGNGSGVGLYLMKKIIEGYGWSITEEGEPGKGVKFVITIPK